MQEAARRFGTGVVRRVKGFALVIHDVKFHGKASARIERSDSSFRWKESVCGGKATRASVETPEGWGPFG